jgi:hypothetical protein
LWVELFDTVDELFGALHEFPSRHNARWIFSHHQYRPPSQVRADLLADAA